MSAWAPAKVSRPAGARRCACGGMVGPTGECAACRAKRLAKEARAGGVRTQAGAPSGVRAHDFGAIDVERKNGVVHGPAGTANHWDDCPTAWRTKATTAQLLGATWVDGVVSGLTHLPKPAPPTVATLLLRHFHTTLDKDIALIVERYRKIQTAIHSSLNFECETSCDPGVLGYVLAVWTDLHLCPDWFSTDTDTRAATVVHEIAHDVVDADDNAYEFQTAKYAGMSVKEAMNNAESYGHFARDASKPLPAPPTPPPAPAPTGGGP